MMIRLGNSLTINTWRLLLQVKVIGQTENSSVREVILMCKSTSYNHVYLVVSLSARST